MGHPPGAVSLPSPAYVDLAPAVERITRGLGHDARRRFAALLRASRATRTRPARRHRLGASTRPPPTSSSSSTGTTAGAVPAATSRTARHRPTAAARELTEETGLQLAPVDADPVTLTLVQAPPDAVGPPHRHWLLGYRFVADPSTPLVVERDPVAWHDVAAPPTAVVADLAPLLQALTAAR